MANNKPTKREQLLSALTDDPTITILVGEVEKVYKPPRSVLYSASPWFRAALDPETFVYGREKTLKLPEVKADTFEDVLYWLFYGCRSQEWLDEAASNDAEDSHVRAINTWVFGDTYLMPALCNFAIRALYSDFEYCTPRVSTIRAALVRSPRGSGLRRLLMQEVFEYLVPTKDIEQYNGDSKFHFMDKLREVEGFVADMCEHLSDSVGSRSLKYPRNEYPEVENFLDEEEEEEEEEEEVD